MELLLRTNFLLGRSKRGVLYFARDVFFISPPDLRAPLADRREILPHDRKLAEFYDAGPKIRGCSPKNGGQKHAKFWSILYRLGAFKRTPDAKCVTEILGRGAKIRKWETKFKFGQLILRKIITIIAFYCIVLYM